MDRSELNERIGNIIENNREARKGEKISFIGDIVDAILQYVDLYIEENFIRKI